MPTALNMLNLVLIALLAVLALSVHAGAVGTDALTIPVPAAP